MVRAYHLIISTYGFWLPNDPRGSWSEFVRAYELAAFGPATRVTTRRSIAGRPYDRSHVRQMKESLARQPVVFDGVQAHAVGEGFAEYSRRSGLQIHACAILPQHVHLAVGRHHLTVESTSERLKAAATTQLSRRGLHPFARQHYRNGRLPTPWARKGWWVYLDGIDDVRRSIAYVEQNPIRAGLPSQRWKFVVPYEE